jgi:hypothetical protein
MATVLITACPRDLPTRFGYYYLRKAADTLSSYGHKIVFLRSANLANFGKALVTYDPRLVMLNGHGGRKAVTGCDQVLLGVVSYDPELGKKILRENPSWMSGRIVFLFTCNAGLELAPRLAEEDALAVVGYKRDYIFLSESSDPAKCTRSVPFFMAPIMFPMTLARGGTVGEAVESVKEAYRRYMVEAETKGDEMVAKYLNYDLENMVVYGKMQVRL